MADYPAPSMPQRDNVTTERAGAARRFDGWEVSLVQIELTLANCCHPSACGAGLAAQQAPIIPPLKGEVGEQSEPGGVGCNNLGRQSNPTRPPVASLRRSTSPERGGTPRLLPPYAIALRKRGRD